MAALAWLRRVVVSIGIGTTSYIIMLGIMVLSVVYDKELEPVITWAFNAGRGIVVHRDSCKNVASYKKSPEKWIEVEWESQVSTDFSAELRLDVINKRGVLATIAAAISATDSNIETINTSERDGNTTTVHLLLNVRDRAHLARVMRQLRTLPEALKLARRG